MTGALGVLVASTGCASTGGVGSGSGSGSGSGAVISVADVRSHQAKLGKDSPCPFRFRPAAVFRAAGVTVPVVSDRSATRGDDDPGQPEMPAGESMGSGPPTLPAIPATTVISCAYLVGSTRMSVDVVATAAADTAVNMSAPMLATNGKLSIEELRPLLRDATATEPGTVVLTPGAGTAAIFRVRVRGVGDMAVTVYGSPVLGDARAPDPDLAGPLLRRIAEGIRPDVRF